MQERQKSNAERKRERKKDRGRAPDLLQENHNPESDPLIQCNGSIECENNMIASSQSESEDTPSRENGGVRSEAESLHGLERANSKELNVENGHATEENDGTSCQNSDAKRHIDDSDDERLTYKSKQSSNTNTSETELANGHVSDVFHSMNSPNSAGSRSGQTKSINGNIESTNDSEVIRNSIDKAYNEVWEKEENGSQVIHL